MEVKGGYWICSLKNAIRKNIDFLKLFWKAKLEEIKPFRIIIYIRLFLFHLTLYRLSNNYCH